MYRATVHAEAVTILFPNVLDGLRWVKFIQAAADSHEAGKARTTGWLD
ncbi:hypothetical protein [Mesorhizobium sp. M1365]